MLRNYVVLTGILTLTGCASTGGMGGGGGSVTVEGVNDQLEDEITVSTVNFERPLFGIVPRGTGDPFLRAYIDKDTGRVIARQLYVYSNSYDWMDWDEARFRAGDELVKFSMEKIGSDVDCSQYGCSHFEDILGTISEEHIKALASQEGPVTIRLTSSRVSSNLDVQFSPKEAQMFLDKIDELTN